MGEIAAADERLGAHWSSVRADRVGRVRGVRRRRRQLCLPLCEAASLPLCRGRRRGRPRWTATVTTRWSVPKAAAARWAPRKKARHDGARKILVCLGKVAGLRKGADMDVEVPYLFTR